MIEMLGRLTLCLAPTVVVGSGAVDSSEPAQETASAALSEEARGWFGKLKLDSPADTARRAAGISAHIGNARTLLKTTGS